MKRVTLRNVRPIDEGVNYKRITYEQVMKSCGKARCRSCGGTRLAHGPYWQLVAWDEKQGRLRTTYVGKQLPADAAEALATKRLLLDPQFRHLVHQADALIAELELRRRDVAQLQRRVARLEEDLLRAQARAPRSAGAGVGRERAARIYKQLALKYHRGRNRSPEAGEFMRDINSLWQALK